MDILAVLKGALPAGVELTEEQLTVVANAVKKEQGLHFVPKDQYNAKAGEVIDLKLALETEKGKATNDEAWKSKYDTLKGEFDDYKTGIETKQTEEQQRAAVRKHLETAGANPEALDLLVSAVLTSPAEELTFKDGENGALTIENWDKAAEPVTAKYSGLFGEIKEHGTNPDTPPAPNATTYTREQIEAMSTEEINANWEAVNQSLQKL